MLMTRRKMKIKTMKEGQEGELGWRGKRSGPRVRWQSLGSAKDPSHPIHHTSLGNVSRARPRENLF
jgi:hypothetical protein